MKVLIVGKILGFFCVGKGFRVYKLLGVRDDCISSFVEGAFIELASEGYRYIDLLCGVIIA